MTQDDKATFAEPNGRIPDGNMQFPSKASTEDLAGGLFSNKNHAMASVVRDLQQRNKRAQQNRSAQEEAQPCDDVCQFGMVETAAAPNEKDVELGNGIGLWVVGGASTVLDAKGETRLESPCAPKGADEQKEDSAVLVAVSSSLSSVDAGCKAATSVPPRQPPKLRTIFSGIADTFKESAEIIWLYPLTVIIPLLVFLLLSGLGIWGVFAGAAAHVKQQKDDVRSRAVDAATGFQIQLQQSFTPGITFQLLVRQQPDWKFWVKNFNQTADELLSRVPKGALWNMQLQPFAQVMMIYPMRPEDDGQVNPPRDLLKDPTRRDGILSAIKNREPAVNGPFNLSQGFMGAFVRYPIYVPDVDANATFGFRYRENTTDVPYSQLPASVLSCTVCYNATTREKWWGILTVLVNYKEVVNGKDAYLANLRNQNLDYELVRPINATNDDVIYRSDGISSLHDADAVTVQVKVINGEWLLRVAPRGGFEPSWKAPLIAAVVIIAFIISLLLSFSMGSFKRQKMLLQETVAANHKLAETTEQLREEKERMDVLLVRQYDLLKCLDANRSKKRDDSLDAAVGSRKAMMAKIEDARRSLNAAKASVEDPIQVFEILGAGAFGKVQRGMWRGTVVAVKTMILPANMTGQEKREKMAVMEAAISSSLVHPNIVTTYTYFIRPYHEPTHEGVQQMPSQFNGVSFSGRGSSDVAALSERSATSQGTEAPIHSYEVRLVLEYCDKGSLKDALDQNVFVQGSLNLAAMLETAADVAKAMVHMHAANVLHSDLKARNIMLKSSGTEGRGVIAKVADFGLSTRMEHQETHLSSCFQGTLTHMAPEVMLEGRISKAADVYSFGILMWELFCGGDPFAGVPRAHIGHAITKEGRRPKFPPFAPRDYVALATSCWDPDAALRPSFEKVLTELVRLREELGGETMPLIVTTPAPIAAQQTTSGGMQAPAAALNTATGKDGIQFSNFGGQGGSGLFMRNNPLALYNAGIVVGGSSMTNGSISGGLTGGGLSIQPRPSKPNSSLYHRAMMKSSLAQRHLRKLGIKLGGDGSSSGLGPALSALDEESEQKDGST
ncbi:hypothetical protein Vretimale_16702 [Volvox reticuliferus]|uniref:Protein kinase domain-containing protein n=1 Tax=Volvox reticuliferus TaxID=1737510 RepID=A0A8J4LWG3_9CHLO|nr:hypothetical protein Vretimale_16702 [Volvox reticuliferus]